jgi:sulfatase modifying factor 1
MAWLLAFMAFTVHARPAERTISAGRVQLFFTVPGEPASAPVKEFSALVLPVSNGEFLEFVRNHPEWRKSRAPRIFAESSYLGQFQSDLRLKTGVRKAAPATNVSWFAAKAFCEAHGMRLPVLNEWEYMAAASETKANASKDAEFLNRILDWYSEPLSADGLPAAGRRAANVYGIHDLHGLVWEWIEDFNSVVLPDEAMTCGASATGAADRENYAAFMRYAFRSALKGNSAAWNLGFRCVRSI